MAVVRKLRLLGAQLHGAFRTGGASPAMTGACAWAAKRGLKGQTPGPNRARPRGRTQAVAPAIPGPATETWPTRRPPHDDRVPAIPPISRDVASPGLCWPAATYRQSWRSTRLNGGYPVAAEIRTPRFIAPHRRAARAERYGQAQSSQRVRHLSATLWTPVYAPGRAKRQRRSVTDRSRGTAPSSGRGHAAGAPL